MLNIAMKIYLIYGMRYMTQTCSLDFRTVHIISGMQIKLVTYLLWPKSQSKQGTRWEIRSIMT